METDKDFIEAANKGEVAGFEGIYYRYRHWVMSLACRFTGNREDALDVLQETFTYLLKKFPGFELRSSMTTFLYPVIKHLSIRIQQKNRKFVSTDQELANLPGPTLPSSPDESRAQLAGALTGLTDGQREVLLMQFVDAMTLQEIAEALEISVGTVKSRSHRALQTLRDNPHTRKYFLQ